MLAVISPAKKLDFDPVGEDVVATQPSFQKDANILADVARDLSVSDLRGLMHISEDLATLNKERFRAFASRSGDRNSKQAALAFAGDTYTGLRAGDFSTDDLDYAQDHLRILSGLYGVLRPMDRIQPYRLEMGSRLANAEGSSLYAYWGKRLGPVLDKAADGVVLNCASQEYFKAAKQSIKSRIITPQFKEDKGGELKMIGFFAKKARGSMARFLIENRITNPDDLKGFDTEGYTFQPALSGENDWVFTRPATT
jgi:cytoplasmic iron level regulating protein YaaA (DUF328/UPF0246 family)